MPISAMMTGMFLSSGAFAEVPVHRVCAVEELVEALGPMAIISDRPIADQIE